MPPPATPEPAAPGVPGSWPTPETPTPPDLAEIVAVVGLTSLNAHAGQPARLASLTHANVVANTNRSAQNAVANQQAHASLRLSFLGHTTPSARTLPPLAARCAVEVLTDGDVLHALPASPRRNSALPPQGSKEESSQLVREVRRLIEELIAIQNANALVQGTGTAADPYVVIDSPLYVAAPAEIVFTAAPATITVTSSPQGVKVSA